MKKCFLVALLLPFGTFSFGADKTPDQSVLIRTEDEEMVSAIARAQASLDDFLRIDKTRPFGASGFKLKVRISDGNGIEHMWVTPFEQTSIGFVGTLADTPDYVKSVVYGQTITFGRADITDWGYSQNGKQKGSFTVCVIFKHMPIAEVEKYRRDYGFEC